MKNQQKYLERIMNPEFRDFRTRVLRGLSKAGALFYGLGAYVYQSTYSLGLAKITRAPVPVIGVGNITVGGTGKTPLVKKIVQILLGMDLPVAVISRGYGRKQEDKIVWVSLGSGPLVRPDLAGDEPFLLAKQLPVPIITGSCRVALIREILSRIGPHIIVGDDLFQHRQLYRDLDIVTLDASAPVGNGWLLPGGILREPATSLRQADAIVLTRADDEKKTIKTRIWLKSFWGNKPVLISRHVVKSIYDHNQELKNLGNIKGQKVLAFCGLAKPCSFYKTLLDLGLEVKKNITFADHHWFSQDDVANLKHQAEILGLDTIVCSEKDRVRLEQYDFAPLKLWSTALELELGKTSPGLQQILSRGLLDWSKNVS